MGEPVRIDSIARRLAREATPHAEVVYTGLRPGEKLHEELFARDEHPSATGNPLITSCAVPGIPIDAVRGIILPDDVEAAKAELVALASVPGDPPLNNSRPLRLIAGDTA
jgi:FlaA1/EpsC-like NDP-sugar epimerase